LITVITITEPANTVNVTEQVTTVTVTDAPVIGAQGEKGDKGDDGADSTVPGPAGPQNLFIQADEPVYNAPFLWLKPLGNGKFDLRYGDGQ